MTATTNGMRSSAADCQMRALFGPKMSFNPNDKRIKPNAIGTWLKWVAMAAVISALNVEKLASAELIGAECEKEDGQQKDGENTSGIIWPVIHGAPEKMHRTPIISRVSALLIAAIRNGAGGQV